MPEFIKKLSEKLIVRAAVTYLMGAWIIMQIAEVMLPALKIPEWVNSGLALLLILFFPVILLIAWSFQTQSKTDIKETDYTPKAGKFDYLIYGAAAVVLLIIATDFIRRENVPTASQEIANTQSTRTGTTTATSRSEETNPESVSAEAPAQLSLAVLPFRDLSANQDQGYFCDGLSEEILNTLTQINGLRVTGRTSSFSFKGREGDIPAIRETLNVGHVLEGSVRKQADRVRITVQLIETESGFSAWSETFERDSSNVFDVQDEIARAVADALEVVLTPSEKEVLARRDTEDQVAYELYLQAKAVLAKRYGDALPTAIELLTEAVERDPNFARAWSTLADAEMLLPAYSRVDPSRQWDIAELHALRALNLNNQLGEAYGVLGYIYTQRRDFIAMEQAFARALQLEPNNITVIHNYASALSQVGKLRESREYYARVIEVDPVIPFGHMGYSRTSVQLGDLEAAEQSGKAARDLGYLLANWYLGEYAGVRGNADEASILIASAMQLGVVQAFDEQQTLLLTRGIYGSDEQRALALSFLDQFISSNENALEEVTIPYFLLRYGESERAFAAFESQNSPFPEVFFAALWSEYGRPSLTTQEFKDFAENIGLADYWRAYGFPDFCRQLSEITFECGELG